MASGRRTRDRSSGYFDDLDFAPWSSALGPMGAFAPSFLPRSGRPLILASSPAWHDGSGWMPGWAGACGSRPPGSRRARPAPGQTGGPSAPAMPTERPRGRRSGSASSRRRSSRARRWPAARRRRSPGRRGRRAGACRRSRPGAAARGRRRRPLVELVAEDVPWAEQQGVHGHLGQRHRSLPGEGMVERGDDHAVLVEQQLVDEVGIVGGQVDDGQVEPALGELGHQERGGGVDHDEADLRVRSCIGHDEQRDQPAGGGADEPRRRLPATSSCSEATSETSASSSAGSAGRRAATASPSSVSLPVARSTRMAPSSRSRRATWVDTFDCTVCSERAAAEKLPVSATARRAASWRRSIAGR